MRYYFIDQEMKETRLDVTKNTNGDFVFFHEGQTTSFKVKTIAGKNYYSADGQTWKKLPVIGANETLVSHTKTFKVYRGYKPAGLNKGGAGSLITQMPGKVVKIFKQEGDKVTKGETVLILEAMKMENEIKAGADGKVKTLAVKEGQALEAGSLMMEIETGE